MSTDNPEYIGPEGGQLPIKDGKLAIDVAAVQAFDDAVVNAIQAAGNAQLPSIIVLGILQKHVFCFYGNMQMMEQMIERAKQEAAAAQRSGGVN